jgi:protein involved in polysaccharide export with SLBB domain
MRRFDFDSQRRSSCFSLAKEKKMSAQQVGKMFVASFIGLALSFLFAMGCANPVGNIQEFNVKDLANAKPAAVPARPPYTMIQGDLLNIKFTYHPEQDPKAQIPIRPDGNIMLEGVGSIQAMGLTPEQLARVIAEKTSSRLKDPEVIVTIAQFGPKRIFIGGQVKNPGVTGFQEGITPLQAIFDRGGFTDTAQMDSVVLIRDAGSENPKIGTLNLLQAMDNAAPEQVTLLANDVIYVPMSGIGRTTLWVRQHLRDIVPSELFSLGSYGRSFGR